VLLSLSTGHTIGLALVAGAFIVFALLVAMVIPRYRPDFPGRNLGAFIWVALAFFVATLLAVEFFGAESKEAEGAQPETTQTAPATTGSTSTEATTTAAGGNATNGQALYTSAGCAGCHSINGSKGTGPTFKGLAGSKTELTNGQSVTADTAYLTKSIDDPDAEIVKGYSPGIMSAVVKPGSVSESDTADLVAFIEKQR
jgi:mono/diheme cytochrome c family protein